MLKRDRENIYPRMTPQERSAMELAIAEETAGMAQNIAAIGPAVARLESERRTFAALVAELRAAREAAGISLSEMATRTGIQKSALSRLENSKAPNPTLSTLQRYAAAIDMTLNVSLQPSRN
ncbi:helix-turn-helix domain-containing protein [Planctomycetes bacterium K23_9]|uniref:HTH-type transcriptional regulator SinR n=1 Tax=Stieleria marina TaxID=1930275 RepID=A0A517P2M4_9BACT|nr:HTH-type transcriptional regulator SinR [Planctomycetes bacterium K23_9]